MYARIIILTLFLQLSPIKAGSSGTILSENLVSPFANSVSLRICCIARLGPIIKFLERLKSHAYDQEILTLLGDDFFKCWNDFSQFRFICDDDFQRYFLMQIFDVLSLLLKKKGLIWPYGQNKQVATYWLEDLECFLFEIGFSKKEKFSFLSGDFSLSINTDTVANRFYVIRRLKKVFYIIKQLQLHDFVFLDKKSKILTTDPLEELSAIVVHPSVQNALHKMIVDKDIAPLAVLFDELKRFKYVDDERFFQEVLMTIFAAYKKILLSDQFSRELRIEIEDELDTILHLYENIDMLTTDELLTSIDMATDHMGLLLQEIEQDQGEWLTSLVFSWPWVTTLAVCTAAAYWLGRS